MKILLCLVLFNAKLWWDKKACSYKPASKAVKALRM